MGVRIVSGLQLGIYRYEWYRVVMLQGTLEGEYGHKRGILVQDGY
jgi:hypothetical protein